MSEYRCQSINYKTFDMLSGKIVEYKNKLCTVSGIFITKITEDIAGYNWLTKNVLFKKSMFA